MATPTPPSASAAQTVPGPVTPPDVDRLLSAALPPALTLDEIDRHRRRSAAVVGPTAAHRFLTALRDRHRDTQNDVFLHDLTHSLEFDWKAWVSQRPDAEDIVGPGIYRFAFVWVSSTDTNLRERRGDFLVSREDVDIRLHPQTRKHQTTGMREALPVRGSWAEQWSPTSPAMVRHGALAASQGPQWPQPWIQPRTCAYHGISAADSVTRQEALRFLGQEEAAWYARPHPRGPFRADITSGASASSQRQFNWPYFVQRRKWFQEHFNREGFTIAAFELAWSDRHGPAVFVGCRSDGKQFTVNPRSVAAEFSWGCDDVSES